MKLVVLLLLLLALGGLLTLDPLYVRYRLPPRTLAQLAECNGDCWVSDFVEAETLQRLINENTPLFYKNDSALSLHVVDGRVVAAIYVRNHFLYHGRGSPIFYNSYAIRREVAP